MTERNYHIFYQLCAGAPSKERRDLGLDTDINKFFYLKQGGPTSTPINGVDDGEEFRATQQALSTVGISVEKQWAVFRLLAAVLHLGNVKITAMRNDASLDDNDPSMLLATRFLGINLAEFKKWTVKKQITTRSEKIITSLNAVQATAVRDSVAKFVYACMFEWLVVIVNESLAGENGDAAMRAETFIGVLDIYGFEHFKKVCASNSFQVCCTPYMPNRTLSNNSASTTPTRSCNKSSTLTYSSSSRRNTSRKKSTGPLSISRTTSLASMSSRENSECYHFWMKSLGCHPEATLPSCKNSTLSS